MEADLGEEVPHDVAQYIKFEMPVLDSFVEKLKEEEEREIIKLTMKFQALRLTMLQRLEQLVQAKQPPSARLFQCQQQPVHTECWWPGPDQSH